MFGRSASILQPAIPWKHLPSPSELRKFDAIQAKSRDHERRTVARIEATKLGLDIRFVVTSLNVGSAEWIYDSLHCARGQA